MPQYAVYTGFWTDHSRGTVVGKQLTLSHDQASPLIAFLALFVGIVGLRCWSILSFVLHQHRATNIPADALHHQSQVVLRNTAGDLPAAYELGLQAWAWRKSQVKASRRLIPIMTLAVSNAIVFGSAGIFSSRVTSTSGDSINDVLVSPHQCGFLGFDIDDEENVASLNAFNFEINRRATDARSYALSCYNGTAQSGDCSTFATPRLPFTIDLNAICPFADTKRCDISPTASIRFDTGLIDTINLGINAPLKDRLLYRKVAVCTPAIAADDALMNVTRSDAYGDPEILFPDDYVLLMQLGPLSGQNFTYAYNDRAPIDGFGYHISTQRSQAGIMSSWTPIPAFNRTDADVSMTFLTQNSIYYTGPVEDPVFVATTAGATTEGITLYQPDYRIELIACIDQTQLCNSNGQDECTPLTSSSLMDEAALTDIKLNPRQISTAFRLLLSTSGIFDSVALLPTALGASCLRALTYMGTQGTGSAPLPSNQWHLETQHWFEGLLANLQQATLEYTTHADVLAEGYALSSPIGPQLEQCHQQKMKSTGQYQSFTVLGLAVILAVGLAIIVISLCIEYLTALIQQWTRSGRYKHEQYIADHTLQLQRLALEQAGHKGWSGADSHVPVLDQQDRRLSHVSLTKVPTVRHTSLYSQISESDEPNFDAATTTYADVPASFHAGRPQWSGYSQVSYQPLPGPRGDISEQWLLQGHPPPRQIPR